MFLVESSHLVALDGGGDEGSSLVCLFIATVDVESDDADVTAAALTFWQRSDAAFRLISNLPSGAMVYIASWINGLSFTGARDGQLLSPLALCDGHDNDDAAVADAAAAEISDVSRAAAVIRRCFWGIS